MTHNASLAPGGSAVRLSAGPESDHEAGCFYARKLFLE